MTMKKILLALAFLVLSIQVTPAQVLDLDLQDESLWELKNRNASPLSGGGTALDAAEGDGMMVLQGHDFENFFVEFDVRGEDKQGASFVGLAYNIQPESRYETIYFRPFNFLNEARKTHSLQYSFEPDYSWSVLREQFPGKYENQLDPAPNPDEWIHVKVTKIDGEISVFVNNESEPSLVVTSLSSDAKGKIGLWVGNGSKGEFRNFQIQKLN